MRGIRMRVIKLKSRKLKVGEWYLFKYKGLLFLKQAFYSTPSKEVGCTYSLGNVGLWVSPKEWDHCYHVIL